MRHNELGAVAAHCIHMGWSLVDEGDVIARRREFDADVCAFGATADDRDPWIGQ